MTLTRPLVVLQLFVLAALTACASLNPIAVANTPEQRYNATLLTYDAILEPAIEVLEDESVPVEVRRSIQAAIATSGEAYDAATSAYSDYKRARAAVAAGGQGQVLEVASENLARWTAELEQTLGRVKALADR